MAFRLTIARRKAAAVAFVAAVELWREQHRQESVAAALAAYQLSKRDRRRVAVDELDWALLHRHVTDHLGPELRDLYGQSWQASFDELASRRPGPLPMRGEPDLDRLVKDRADVLVDSTWDAVNTVASMVIAQNLDPWTGAALILAMAGLNRPQAISAANYRTALARPPKKADGTPGTPPADDVIQRRLERMVRTKLRKRGTLVGWYEPGHAVGMGRLDAWRFYGDHGGVAQLGGEGLQPMREWVVNLAGNPCDECWHMNGQRVGLYESFPGGDPPRHPACQCSDVLVEVPMEQAGRLAA